MLRISLQCEMIIENWNASFIILNFFSMPLQTDAHMFGMNSHIEKTLRSE